MKQTLIKIIFFAIILAGFAACKKEVYPEELHFIVIDSFTRKPIANAAVYLSKTWQNPRKIGNNAQAGDWFPEYGRKHMIETQTGNTNNEGKISFSQDHKKYLYIIPSAIAEGYQMPVLDTLRKFRKKNANDAVYEIVMQPMVKTTFIFKSQTVGVETDSLLFSSCDKVKVMRGAQIDDSLVVYTRNYIGELNTNVWYGGNISRNGKKQTLCSYVVSQVNKNNAFRINIDL
jgi:hypothetical protein